VAVNKMDDPTVNWDKARWDEIVAQLSPFIKQVGYNLKTDVKFVPLSAIKGTNIKEPMSPEVCDWYKGKSLLTTLDGIVVIIISIVIIIISIVIIIIIFFTLITNDDYPKN